MALVVLLGIAGCGGDDQGAKATSAASGNGATSEKAIARERPEAPGQPERHETARKTQTSGEPASPRKAETSRAPTSPRDPEKPEEPQKAETSGEPPSARNPDSPRSPEKPEAPQKPVTSGEPSSRRNPGNLGTSQSQQNPGGPGKPENSQNPRNPEEPEAPAARKTAESPAAVSDDVTASNEVRLGGANGGLVNPNDNPDEMQRAEPRIRLGSLEVGESRTYVITVRNVTQWERTIAAVNITPTDEFQLAGGSCTAKPVLQKGQTCTVRATYTPTASGSHDAKLSFWIKPCNRSESCTYGRTLAGDIVQ